VEVVRQTELIEAVRKVLAGEARVESAIVTGNSAPTFFSPPTVGSGSHDASEWRSGRAARHHRPSQARTGCGATLWRMYRTKFRTPLTAIQGFSETLLGGAVNDPQNRDRFLGIILEHARRLARLTDDLLMLSKMDADRLELELRRLPVEQLVGGCVGNGRNRRGRSRKICGSP